MEEYITFSEALLVSIVSMLAVFIILLMISFLINGLKILGGEKEKNENKEKPELEIRTVPKVSENLGIDETFNEELVAVISAAVAANLGVSLPDVRIKTIKKIPNDSDN